MNDLELVEYAVFNWVHGNNHDLPGLDNNGFIDKTFFDAYPTKSNYTQFEALFDGLTEEPCLEDHQGLMLCSGGVDSSLLASVRNSNFGTIPQDLLHTSYVSHNDNDIEKFNSLLNAFSATAYLHSIDEHSYMKGIDLLSSISLLQNTYAPTLIYALANTNVLKYRSLITGSGPDELFYGMEKYSWNIFEKLGDLPRISALRELEPRYNETIFATLFNDIGRELYAMVLEKKEELYSDISSLGFDIFDSQRILAYTTVTTQHVQLFNTVAQHFGLQHRAPFLNRKLVHAALNVPIIDLITMDKNKNVEIGKKYLKSYLCKFMPAKHVYSKKIGFHAPTSRFIRKIGNQFIIDNIEYLPDWLDKDLTLSEIKRRLSTDEEVDYASYTLLNILKHRKGKMHAH